MDNDERRNTVLHVLNELHPSGMERMFVSGRETFLKDRVIIVGQGQEHPMADALRSAGFEVVLTPAGSTWRGLLALRRLVRERRPDVVHLHSESTFLHGVIATRFRARRVPIVRTIHNVFDKQGIRALARRLTSWIADPFVDTFITVSDEVAEQERRSLGRRSTLVWNWVDPEFSAPLSSVEDSRRLLLVGNCSTIKNHAFALDVLRALSDDFSLTHVGSTALMPSDEHQAVDNLAARVEMVSSLSPFSEFESAAIFLMPSLHEGMSVAAAEALTRGLVVLVADSPGLRWAGEFAGAEVLPLDVDTWVDAVLRMVSGQRILRDTSRFDSRVGPQHYRDIYRRAISADVS